MLRDQIINVPVNTQYTYYFYPVNQNAFSYARLTGKVFTGGTSVCKISHNGAAFVNTTNLPTEIANGWYSIVLTAAEMNFQDNLLYMLDSAGTEMESVWICTTSVGGGGTTPNAIWSYPTSSISASGSIGTLLTANIDSDLATIQSGVTSINATVGTINTNVSSVESTVGTTNTTVNAINTNVSSVETTVGVINTNVSLALTDLGSLQSSVNLVQNQTAQITAVKNTALNNFEFVMISSVNHITPVTGLTVTGQVSKDGGSFVALTNSVSEIANGVYKVSLAAADLNGTVVMLLFTAVGADPRYILLITQG